MSFTSSQTSITFANADDATDDVLAKLGLQETYTSSIDNQTLK